MRATTMKPLILRRKLKPRPDPPKKEPPSGPDRVAFFYTLPVGAMFRFEDMYGILPGVWVKNDILSAVSEAGASRSVDVGSYIHVIPIRS